MVEILGQTVVAVHVIDGRVWGHLEDHFHVEGGAGASDPAMDVRPGGGGNEIIVLPRSKFQAARRGGEGAECDGEVHEVMGLVADGNYPRVGLGDAAGIVLGFVDAVDNVLLVTFRVPFSLFVHGAHYVDLVILPGVVACVDVDDVVGVVNAEDGVGGVPVDAVHCGADHWVEAAKEAPSNYQHFHDN